MKSNESLFVWVTVSFFTAKSYWRPLFRWLSSELHLSTPSHSTVNFIVQIHNLQGQHLRVALLICKKDARVMLNKIDRGFKFFKSQFGLIERPAVNNKTNLFCDFPRNSIAFGIFEIHDLLDSDLEVDTIFEVSFQIQNFLSKRIPSLINVITFSFQELIKFLSTITRRSINDAKEIAKISLAKEINLVSSVSSTSQSIFNDNRKSLLKFAVSYFIVDVEDTNKITYGSLFNRPLNYSSPVRTKKTQDSLQSYFYCFFGALKRHLNLNAATVDFIGMLVFLTIMDMDVPGPELTSNTI